VADESVQTGGGLGPNVFDESEGTVNPGLEDLGVDDDQDDDD
jgi:hypothetical protein